MNHYGRKISLAHGLYFDGDVTLTLADCVRLARAEGATRIYVSDTHSGSYLQSALEIGVAPLLSRDFIKTLIGLRRKAASPPIGDTSDILYFRPRMPLQVSSLNNTKKTLEEAVHAGYAETMATLRAIHP